MEASAAKAEVPHQPSLKERAAEAVYGSENRSANSLKERVKERLNKIPAKVKSAARKIIIYSLIAINIGNAYNYISEGDPYYNNNDLPIVAAYNSIIVRTSKENLKMVEYINKNTQILKAEFKPVEQRGYVTSNTILLNGLTDAGYWYQGGIATTHGNKIYLAYDVFNDEGVSIDPKWGGGHVNFDKKVNLGDTFQIEVTIKNGIVSVVGKDENTGAVAKKDFQAVGNTFVATSKDNKKGLSTSIFREMWVTESFDTKEIVPPGCYFVVS